jgi:hypothetical protein
MPGGMPGGGMPGGMPGGGMPGGMPGPPGQPFAFDTGGGTNVTGQLPQGSQVPGGPQNWAPYMQNRVTGGRQAADAGLFSQMGGQPNTGQMMGNSLVPWNQPQLQQSQFAASYNPMLDKLKNLLGGFV